MKFVILALCSPLCCGSAHAQGNQCRTASVGASTANCASEAFVTESIGAIPPPSGGTVTEQKDTGSVGIATSGNCDNTTTNAASPCDHHLALNNATLQASPSNPTGTTATAGGVMMGLGATCKITPVYSGRLLIDIQGSGSNTTTAAAFNVQLRYGTGSAPANGATPSGTTLGTTVLGLANPANYIMPFKVGGIATGLTPGTAYWIDVSLYQTSGGTASIQQVGCSALEF